MADLFDLASHGSTHELELVLFCEGKNPNVKSKFAGMTPLHMAALNNEHGAVQLLLAKGADPNAQDDLGATPLHYAAKHGALDVVLLLLGSGANPLIKDARKGATALEWAVNEGNEGIAQVLATVAKVQFYPKAA